MWQGAHGLGKVLADLSLTSSQKPFFGANFVRRFLCPAVTIEGCDQPLPSTKEPIHTMLANLCASKVFSLSTRRGYTSAASERPVTFWNHAYAANKAPFEQAPTESSHGVSGALIEKMRRLRHEAPHTFTAKRLSRNFNLSRTTINRVAPYEAPGAAVRSCGQNC